MPVVRLLRSEMRKLYPEIDFNEFVERIPLLGADVKRVEEEEIHVEFFPDRPDLYTVEGVIRAYKGFIGREIGLPRYGATPSGIEVTVDESVASVRPYIACAVVRGAEVDEPFIKSVMDAQEKLHETVGRRRRKVAIGLHDLDRVVPPFTYRAAPPDSIRFVPLGFDREMTLRDVLREHPKGREYGHILEGADAYPVILDARGEVLSFPPIINGVLTQVREDTRNIFIDVTGTHRPTVMKVATILTTSLAERGWRVETVEVRYPSGPETSPDLAPRKMEVPLDYIRRIISPDLREEEIVGALHRMRMGAEVVGSVVHVEIPPFRADIMHPVDVVEDVAIGHGYWRFEGHLPERYTVGEPLPVSGLVERVRLAFVGLGHLEVTTLTLSSEARQYNRMSVEPEPAVVVMNPITEDHTVLRTWLIPSLLEILAENRHRETPQRIFEVGDVVDARGQGKKLAFAVAHSRAGFSEAKSIVEAFLTAVGIRDYVVEPKEHGSFIPGRCAAVMRDGVEIGFFGEIHPEVLERFELTNPVAAGEFDLRAIKEITG